MKLIVLSCAAATATAFAPMPANLVNTAMRSTADEQQEFETSPAASSADEIESAPMPINGWVPDDNLPCYGLPGALAPTGYFDPIGFSGDIGKGTKAACNALLPKP